jgi:hypothetical protein
MGNLEALKRENNMKRFYLGLLALTLIAGGALAQAPVVAPDWAAFVIRNGATGSPVIQDNDDIVTDSIEFATWESGQKAGLGTNLINGAKVSQITSLHIDRLDNLLLSSAPYGPYINIWVTDGLGHYAVIANEPSNPEWAANRWYVANWDYLKTKTCKVYETTGVVSGTPGTSWVAAAIGWTSGAITFANVGNLTISAPPAAYLAAGNGTTTGAPDELGTNTAYGYNWIFGDTMANYVTTGAGAIVNKYTVAATFPVTNVTQGTHFTAIQPAVDAANAGDAIVVAAGHFVEQVHITVDNLSITGAGVGQTFIDSPVVLPLSYTTTAVNKAVVFVDHADGVALANLTVDGLGRGNSNYRFQGIGYWNAGGSLTDMACLNVMDTPFSGAQHGVGVYAIVTDGTPHAFAMTDVLVEDFQKNALVIAGIGMDADLLRVTAIGQGPTAVTAQNGLQVSGGALADVVDCDVSGVVYTGSGATASGVLSVTSAIANFDGCTIDACQTSAYFSDGGGSFTNGSVTNPTGDALYAYSSGAKALTSGRPLAQPYDADLAATPNKVAIAVHVSGSTFIGAGVADSWGPSAYGYGPNTFTVDNCEITNWDYGVMVYNYGGATFNAAVSNCNIHDNASYGLYTNSLQTVEATCNWWGTTSGPNTLGSDAISTGATYAPWLDAVGGACVLYGDNNVGVGNAAVCLTPANTCVTIPVTFNRLDTTPSRGVSVTIQLSPELVLCSGDPYTDIVEATGAGSWSGTTYSNLVYQVVDNTGGSYTIDRAILGDPCGPTTGGTLFTLNLKKALGVTTDAIGTVTVTEVIVRDCDNAVLDGVPGAAGSVSINVTIPAVLAGLTATQDKLGNGSDGTTAINLAWTVPTDDAATITLYRKGFGAYPEYNDAGGIAPVVVDGSWTHVTTVDATDAGYIDEPAARDFWYYAATVTDACGNVSAASAITGGTLNYHLGDVHNGAIAGSGDNLVNWSDITNLGFNYGITLTPGDARNYLDVGPTTNYSVNARPTTDNRVQFEDLIMFAMNYELVSKVEPQTRPANVNAISLAIEEPGAVGSTFDVSIVLAADGRLQGLSVPLTWDAAVAVPVDMQAGDLLASHGELALVLSPAPGTVDAALMGVREKAIAGEGVLATVTFRTVAAGDPRIALGAVTARDSANQPVAINGTGSNPPSVNLPSVSELRANVPNPFNPSTEFSFVLAQDGPVSLRVYTVRGQLVRTLLDQGMAAGPHALTWNGVDDQGRQVASGGYIVRFVASDRTQSRHITLLK